MNVNFGGRIGAKQDGIQTLGKQAPEQIDHNFDTLYTQVRRIMTALRGYQVDLSSEDITGILPVSFLNPPVPVDLTKFLRSDGLWAVPPIDGGDASGIRTYFATHVQNVWTDMGCATSAVAGTHPAQSDAGGMFERWTTAAAANAQAGWRMTGGQYWADHDPDIMYRFRTGADITNLRLWLGGYATIPTGAIDTPVARSVGVRFSTVAGDASWRGLYVDAAGTMTLTAAIGSIAASTIYDVRIKVTAAGTAVAFTINGATASLAMTNATGLVLTTIFLMGTGASASARVTDFQRCHVETN